ncbi:MAG TPA: penicillin-binding transpeptidase domain-containing protein [Terriglobia bacterium]
MKKTILGLTLAASLMLAGFLTPSSAAAASAGSTTKRTPGTAGNTSKHMTHLHHPVAHKSSLRAASPKRPLRHTWASSAWFVDPTAGDEIAGEDMATRQAAVNALGHLNGSVVVLDPNTGRILSIVNQKLALTEAFTPCSTFKPVVATAALREGIITPETRLRAEGRFMYYFGTTRITLTQALAESSNEFFAKLGEMLGFRRVTQYAREFGLGERAGLDIPGESPGVFPSAPPVKGGVGLLTSFGQDIEMTPLQLAAIAAAIANGGTLYYLQYPRTPEAIADFEPQVRRQLEGVSSYLSSVKQGMAAVVEFGTGKLAFTPDEPILGKTGTCSENGTHLRWFASFSDNQRLDRVVVVLLRGEGSMFGLHAPEIAGKVYKDLIEAEKTGSQADTVVPALLPAPKLTN